MDDFLPTDGHDSNLIQQHGLFQYLNHVSCGNGKEKLWKDFNSWCEWGETMNCWKKLGGQTSLRQTLKNTSDGDI